MSTVERALKKLREAAAAGGAPVVPRQPIADADGALRDERVTRTVVPRATVKLDFEVLRSAGLYASENQAVADQYRVIKRPLLAKATAPAGEAPEFANLVVVASALAGEGKTFTCINLALSIAAEKDWRVVLIDADCKNPQLSRLLGAEERPGLLDVLKNETVTVDSVLMGTNIPRLAVIPLGARDEQAAELVASARMKQICNELAKAEPRQFVIFDTSPLLLTTESSVVATHVGQAVIVVKAGRTPQQAVMGAIHKLDPSKAIGLVLNCANETGEAFRYGTYGSYPYSGAPGTQR
jgi:exopolysaccharide/PEP-CTERM locus tyrosine autokinase